MYGIPRLSIPILRLVREHAHFAKPLNSNNGDKNIIKKNGFKLRVWSAYQ